MQPLQLSLDFCSKTTGLALCRIEDTVDASGVAEPSISCSSWYSSVTAIRDALLGPCSRAALAPEQSSLSRTAVQQPQQTDGLAAAIHRYDHGMRCPATVSHLAQELVCFDMQLLQNPDISGVGYQQGMLADYEVHDYLHGKFGHICAYCDTTVVPQQIEHIHARAAGGSNHVSNLTLGCRLCTSNKAAQNIRASWRIPPARLTRILHQVRMPLRDAAAVMPRACC